MKNVIQMSQNISIDVVYNSSSVQSVLLEASLWPIPQVKSQGFRPNERGSHNS